jgi:beta-glucanase (GH16 family)
MYGYLKALTAISLFGTLLSGSTANVQAATLPSPTTVPQNYQLTWADEFNGTKLDLTKWNYRYPGPREGTIVSPKSVSLDGQGHLQISTKTIDNQLHVGMIGTQNTFQQKYGYFEARIKFEEQQGHHGAFWLQSPTYGQYLNDPGKSGAEIDIAEYFGDNRWDRGAGTAVHWNGYGSGQLQTASVKPNLNPILGPFKPGKSPELSDDFHIFGVNWTEQEYVFTIDGHETFRTRNGLSHVPQYMVLSLLSSGWERSRLNVNALPDSMYVDYVRVYEPRKTKVPESSTVAALLTGGLYPIGQLCHRKIRAKSR